MNVKAVGGMPVLFWIHTFQYPGEFFNGSVFSSEIRFTASRLYDGVVIPTLSYSSSGLIWRKKKRNFTCTSFCLSSSPSLTSAFALLNWETLMRFFRISFINHSGISFLGKESQRLAIEISSNPVPLSRTLFECVEGTVP